MLGSRAQQDLGAVDGARRQHHHMGGEQPGLAINFSLNPAHLSTRGVDMQAPHPSAFTHLHRGLSPGWIDTKQFGIAGGILG